MAKFKVSSAFKVRLSEKLMDLGNYAVVGLAIGQLATGTQIAGDMLLLGVSSAVILYIAGYIISQ